MSSKSKPCRGGRYTAGCRCSKCRARYAEYRRRGRRTAKRNLQTGASTNFVHGITGYATRGCRCEVCLKAGAAQYNKVYRALAEPLADGARRRGYQWTGPELELASRTDLSITEIAQLLGRTYAGVKAKRQQMKVDPRVADLAGTQRPTAQEAVFSASDTAAIVEAMRSL